MVSRALGRSAPGVVVFPGPARLAYLDTSAGRISLTIHRSHAPAATFWKALQASPTVSLTHAQCYESARAWYEHVSPSRGAEPLIVAGRYENGKPQFLLPFEVGSRFGLRTLTWVGQDLANYNMGLFEKSFAEQISGADMRILLKSVCEEGGGFALAELRNQPLVWDGIPNPLVRLDHQQAANSGYATLLDADFETFYRNRFSGRTRNSLRRKERKLADMGELQYARAAGEAECLSILGEFLRQKAAWFRRNGIPDVFSVPEYRAYFEQLALLPEGTPGRLELGYLRVGERIAATYNGSVVNGRFHLLLSSIEGGEMGRWSPGIILLRHQIKEMCLRGCHRYDMGTGLAQHKSEWADEENKLFDTLLAFNAAGHAMKIPLRAAGSAKRFIKSRPALWSMATKVRQAIAGR
ncbi:MAG: GNAT family N-acetyltransferase [Methyloligellaceae bacterium]